MSNKNQITYRRVGDYNIPNLAIPSEEANITLGMWGILHKDYIIKHNKLLLTTLLAQGKLYQHCAEIESQAKNMYDTLIEQMKKAESITEKLKEENQMERVCSMQNIEERARELVCTQLVIYKQLYNKR